MTREAPSPTPPASRDPTTGPATTNASSRRSRRRTLALGLVVAAASVAFALVLAEFGFRLFFRDPLGLHRTSASLGYEMVPNYSGRHKKLSEYDVRIETNSRGQRDREYGPAEMGPRVLSLGDSETFGWGVEADETYPKQTEGLLRAQGRPISVINAGVWGYNTLQEIAYLKAGASGYRPDLVLVGVTSPVTLVRNLWSGELGGLTLEPFVDDPKGAAWAHWWLKRHSHVYSFLHRRWRYKGRIAPSFADLKRMLGLGAATPETAPGSEVAADNAAPRKAARDSAAPPSTPAPQPYPTALPASLPDDEAVAWTVELLNRLRAQAEAMGAPLAVVVFPEMYDVYAMTQKDTTLRTLAINRNLVARLESQGIPTLDLGRVLAERFPDAPLYLPHDFFHLNRFGHRVSAEAISRFVVERLPDIAARTRARSPIAPAALATTQDRVR